MKTLIIPSNFDLLIQISIFIIIFGIGVATGLSIAVNHYKHKDKP